MRPTLCLLMILSSGALMAAQLKVDVNAMPRIVFTGDSQTCGCVGAMDYPQMLLNWINTIRIFNRAVGGSNTTHLLYEFGGGAVTVKAGDRVVHGTEVSWYAGPYPGQTVRIGTQHYTVDCIETLDYAKRICNLHLTEPAREDYTGTDYKFEPGWRIRVADVQPQYACFMFTVNDPGWKSEEFKARLAEITKRCREAGIQPIFLSGVPFEDAESGGSHAGSVEFDKIRPQDMLEFCQEQKLPFGDVYRTLDLLDPQRTSVWADTIHPTNDGSIVPVHALRYLLDELGLNGNPYWVSGHWIQGADLPNIKPGVWAGSLTTAQPRRDKNNRENQAGANLEAQRLRDQYGLIAAADGQALEHNGPLLLNIGVGPVQKLQSAEAEVVLGAPGEVLVFSYKQEQWLPLAQGQGRLTATLPPPLADLYEAKRGCFWLAVRGQTVAVDHVALNLTGDVAPWQPPKSDRALLWPPPGLFDWPQQGNLMPNGDLTQVTDAVPTGWMKEHDGARYLPAGVVAQGTGEFTGPKLNQFKCAGAKFTQTVRPLDLLVVKTELEGGPNFRVAKIIDDETLALRRWPKTAPGAVAFEVQHDAGLKAVPGGNCLECRADGQWQTVIPVPAGQYRLGFFYRVFDPASMNALDRPSWAARVVVADEQGREFVSAKGPECSHLWLRAFIDIEAPVATKLTVTCGNRGRETMLGLELGKATEAVQYTGFSLTPRK